jgi:hypothetical protein
MEAGLAQHPKSQMMRAVKARLGGTSPVVSVLAGRSDQRPTRQRFEEFRRPRCVQLDRPLQNCNLLWRPQGSSFQTRTNLVSGYERRARTGYAHFRGTVLSNQYGLAHHQHIHPGAEKAIKRLVRRAHHWFVLVK